MTDDAKLDGSQEVRGVNLTPELEDLKAYGWLCSPWGKMSREAMRKAAAAAARGVSYVTEAVETAFGCDVSDVFCDLYHLDM